jgi:hypothetical protein
MDEAAEVTHNYGSGKRQKPKEKNMANTGTLFIIRRVQRHQQFGSAISPADNKYIIKKIRLCVNAAP